LGAEKDVRFGVDDVTGADADAVDAAVVVAPFPGFGLVGEDDVL
jgi:hypothetical protein